MLKFLLFFISVFAFAQNDSLVETEKDSLFREDQFYMGVTYNLMQNKPTGFAQNGFSGGLNFGFMRDMPINKNRTWAIATGLGYSYNNLKQNIKIENLTNDYQYSIDNNFTKNKLVLHYLELPVEIRWRNATLDSHKFWRVYTGFKFNYLINNKSEYTSSSQNINIKKNTSLNKFIYGPYLAIGYNSINLYAYYAMVPIVKNKFIGTEDLNLNSFNIGLQFYIL